MQPRSILAFVTIALLSLTACGSAKSVTSAGADASTSSRTTFTAGDVTFAQGMIPHHEQAIEMSDQALNPAAGAGDVVKGLASRVKAAQDPEIKQLKALLTSWGKPVEMPTEGHDMAAMDGMMSAKDMANLGSLTGPAFDKLWAAMMIEHHKGAITMAKKVQKDGSNPDTAKLAAAVIAGQLAEIELMKPIAA